jgi:hypothetical protein
VGCDGFLVGCKGFELAALLSISLYDSGVGQIVGLLYGTTGWREGREVVGSEDLEVTKTDGRGDDVDLGR